MILIGLGFKVSAAPFQVWTPDVYEGAPSPVVALMSTAPKIAAFAVLLRLTYGAYPQLQTHWLLLVWIMAALSMTIGNLGALRQHSVKRYARLFLHRARRLHPGRLHRTLSRRHRRCHVLHRDLCRHERRRLRRRQPRRAVTTTGWSPSPTIAASPTAHLSSAERWPSSCFRSSAFPSPAASSASSMSSLPPCTRVKYGWP